MTRKIKLQVNSDRILRLTNGLREKEGRVVGGGGGGSAQLSVGLDTSSICLQSLASGRDPTDGLGAPGAGREGARGQQSDCVVRAGLQFGGSEGAGLRVAS